MGEGSAYSYIALTEAIKESGLEEKDISNEKTGIVIGSGGPSIKNVVSCCGYYKKVLLLRRMGPYIVPRTMASTCSATLAVPFKIKGVNYSISSACSTSAHCIGNGMELIQLRKTRHNLCWGWRRIRLGSFMQCLMQCLPCLQNIMSTPRNGIKTI